MVKENLQLQTLKREPFAQAILDESREIQLKRGVHVMDIFVETDRIPTSHREKSSLILPVGAIVISTSFGEIVTPSPFIPTNIKPSSRA